MAKCAKSKKDPHACENLHNLIRNNGNQLPVEVSTVPCWIRTSRKRVHQVLTNYPVLRVVDWVKTIFSYGGHFFLGGKSLDDAGSFREDLTTFWRNYQVIDPSLPFFAGPGESSWANTIPIAVHGDEGRGKCKNPIMVTSVQPIMPLCGNRTNMQGFLEHNPANIYFFFGCMIYFYGAWESTSQLTISSPDFCHSPGLRCALGCCSPSCHHRTRRKLSTNSCKFSRTI